MSVSQLFGSIRTLKNRLALYNPRVKLLYILLLSALVYSCNDECSGFGTILDSNDFVAISAGWSHSLALKSDGSIVGWGDNIFGQVSPPGPFALGSKEISPTTFDSSSYRDNSNCFADCCEE